MAMPCGGHWQRQCMALRAGLILGSTKCEECYTSPSVDEMMHTRGGSRRIAALQPWGVSIQLRILSL